MNETMNLNPSCIQNPTLDDPIIKSYRPRLSFYHPNGKGTGSAIQFERIPAQGDREGGIFMRLALQKTVATGSRHDGTRQHATFDWQNRLIVKLGFTDLCAMLMVLIGRFETIAEGKGLFHDSKSHITTINLTRQIEPVPGLILEVSRRSKTEPATSQRIRMLISESEALGLRLVFEQSLSVITFGIPKEPAARPRGNDLPPMQDETEPETDAIPF
ncbi:MAG: hypothetical protein J6334_00395 [Kiritimatiellae bacterium]|nr:hypothetical protein [Kiritimatiellia bacterium]